MPPFSSAAGRSAVVFALGAAVAEWTSLPSGTEGLLGKGPLETHAWLTTLLIGFLAMGLLPTMERWFDRVTRDDASRFAILATPCCRS